MRHPEGNEVHLWRADLGAAASQRGALLAALSGAERRRCQEFREPGTAERWGLSRAVLRSILGRYLAVPPGAVPLEYEPNGRLRLGGARLPDLRFSLSRSAELFLVAVATGREVGVDVERRDAAVEVDAILRRFGAPWLRDGLLARAEDERRQAFFDHWTRHEAYVKASGVGLSDELLVGDEPLSTGWSWQPLDLGADYAGAIVVRSPDPDPGQLRIVLLGYP